MVNLTGVGVLLPIKSRKGGGGGPAAYSTITLHMRMEIEAVTAAIMAGSQEDTYTVIPLKSQSMLYKIERFMLRKWAALLEKSRIKSITLIYCLDDAGVRGKE